MVLYAKMKAGLCHADHLEVEFLLRVQWNRLEVEFLDVKVSAFGGGHKLAGHKLAGLWVGMGEM